MAQNRGRARHRHRHRHRASFPADATFHLLEIGIQAIQLSPYHAGPATRRLQRGASLPHHAATPHPCQIVTKHHAQDTGDHPARPDHATQPIAKLAPEPSGFTRRGGPIPAGQRLTECP
jgi:hypothetical protein